MKKFNIAKFIKSNVWIIFNSLGRFRPHVVNKLIHQVLGEVLTGRIYTSENGANLSKEIADTIKGKVRGFITWSILKKAHAEPMIATRIGSSEV